MAVNHDYVLLLLQMKAHHHSIINGVGTGFVGTKLAYDLIVFTAVNGILPQPIGLPLILQLVIDQPFTLEVPAGLRTAFVDLASYTHIAVAAHDMPWLAQFIYVFKLTAKITAVALAHGSTQGTRHRGRVHACKPAMGGLAGGQHRHGLRQGYQPGAQG